MGEFDEDDLFDKKNCNIGEVFKEMRIRRKENLPKCGVIILKLYLAILEHL